MDIFVCVLIAIAIIVVVGLSFYNFAFSKPCYRITENTRMRYDGRLKTEYVVQQYHQVLWLEWWSIESRGGEFDNGSVFDTKEEAETYIRAMIYNMKRHQVINEPICKGSYEKAKEN